MGISANPIEKIGDAWWFWTETWNDRYGPYPTQEEANKQLKRYALWLDGKGDFMPPNEYIDKKMKEMGIDN